MSVSDRSGSDQSLPWIADWCTNIPGNDWFVQIDEVWIEDNFNFGHLTKQVPHFWDAYSVITDRETLDDYRDEDDRDMIYRCAELLYGVLHAKYITQGAGLKMMLYKWQEGKFEKCPRVYCYGTSMLPYGQSSIPSAESVKLYCPRCRDLYRPRHSFHRSLDGAYFGPEYVHMLFMRYPEYRPLPPRLEYTPRLFGFKLYDESNSNSNTQSQDTTWTLPASKECTGKAKTVASPSKVAPGNKVVSQCKVGKENCAPATSKRAAEIGKNIEGEGYMKHVQDKVTEWFSQTRDDESFIVLSEDTVLTSGGSDSPRYT